VRPEDVAGAATRYGGGRFEVGAGRIRVSAVPSVEAHTWTGGPDILYHATNRLTLERYRTEGVVAGDTGGPVHLSRSETQAWRVAHRHWDDPNVLFVDACRARREGHPFARTRVGQYYAQKIPLRYVLNLRDGFAEQASAGGFLVEWSSGAPRIALIRVVRRSSSTWEVAKGKIEAGETPDDAALREVREEMGVEAPMRVSRALGTVRYGFSTPEGDPRLKTIYLYVLEVDGQTDAFRPARAEGIDAVRWFTVEDALNALAHPSLRGSIGRLVAALEERAAELGLDSPVARAG
jgi:8-oxo-dGTP pyrophosphatase MutT (NUDIX family)